MYEENDENPLKMIKIPDEFKNLFGKFKRSGNTVIIAIILIYLVFSSVYKIETEEIGVVLRFGKFTKTVDPGLHFKIPYVEEVEKVAAERQQKLEFGFRTLRAGVNTQYDDRPYTDESLMLTGDLNLADVEWVVQYRIDDAYNYLFKVREPETTLRDISESAMRQIVGDRTVNEVLTVGRAEIETELERVIQEICNEYQMGVKIDQIVLQDVNPPEQVKSAFNEVNQAQQEKETLINQAKSQYNQVIPKASGQADETIQKAEGYATERVNNALGEVARFNQLYAEYIKYPEVTKKRIYLETMSSVIPKLGNKIITDEGGQSILPLLQMQLDKK